MARPSVVEQVEFIRRRRTDYERALVQVSTPDTRARMNLIALRGGAVYGFDPMELEVKQLAQAREFFDREISGHTHVCATCATEWSGE